ncbi:MAG: hypothetical protein FJ088_04460 [Deltaproteobacteria bacterium]|nr:hypothetical protein [Deltaproteobacteria bacterium]
MRIFIALSMLSIFISCEKPKVSEDRIKAVFAEGDLREITYADPKWKEAFETTVKLETQQIALPKLEEPGVSEVRTKVLYNDKWLAFLLDWNDATQDKLTQIGLFSDAAAIQFPSQQGELPDNAMGGLPGSAGSVVIHQWKAVWQEASLGNIKGVKTFYPNTWSDVYIFEEVKQGSRAEMEKMYTTSVAAGNPLAHHGAAVRDLEAAGFGSVDFSPEQSSKGSGLWKEGKWSVVIVRPVKREKGSLELSKLQYMAFAVWDGSHGETGARKMRSGWIPIQFVR